jgi:hypothetical protein
LLKRVGVAIDPGLVKKGLAVFALRLQFTTPKYVKCLAPQTISERLWRQERTNPGGNMLPNRHLPNRRNRYFLSFTHGISGKVSRRRRQTPANGSHRNVLGLQQRFWEMRYETGRAG